LKSISNLNCPGDLPSHTPVQEWHIQHLTALLQRKSLTHNYLGGIKKFSIVSALLSCSMASVELLFMLGPTCECPTAAVKYVIVAREMLL